MKDITLHVLILKGKQLFSLQRINVFKLASKITSSLTDLI